jgi:hypothetical protein
LLEQSKAAVPAITQLPALFGRFAGHGRRSSKELIRTTIAAAGVISAASVFLKKDVIHAVVATNMYFLVTLGEPEILVYRWVYRKTRKIIQEIP